MGDWPNLRQEQALGGTDLTLLRITMTTKDFVEDLPINGSKQMVDVESVVMDGLRILDSMKHPEEGLPPEP